MLLRNTLPRYLKGIANGSGVSWTARSNCCNCSYWSVTCIDVLSWFFFFLISVNPGNPSTTWIQGCPIKMMLVGKFVWYKGRVGKNNFYSKSRKSLRCVSLLVKSFISILLMYFLATSWYNPLKKQVKILYYLCFPSHINRCWEEMVIALLLILLVWTQHCFTF